MKPLLIACAVLMTTTAVPTSVAAQTGSFFTFAADIGHGRWLGSVSRGSRIVVSLTTLRLVEDLTCPYKATIWVMRDNNSGVQQRKIVRGNGTSRTFEMTRTNFGGEAFLVVQTQNAAHDCFGLIDAFVDLENATATSPLGDGTASHELTDDLGPAPEASVPADPAVVRALRRFKSR